VDVVERPVRHALVRIAILGTRGVPARYGGFETFAEELGARLAARGHEVTVYGRNQWVLRGIKRHRGMQIKRLPAPRSKYLETVVHTLFAAFAVAPRRYDVIYMCNVANAPAVLVLLAARKKVVLNVDGLEWQRAKWGMLGRSYYRLCAWLAAKLPIPTGSASTDAPPISSPTALRCRRSPMTGRSLDSASNRAATSCT
jgi:hypothetical protein